MSRTFKRTYVNVIQEFVNSIKRQVKENQEFRKNVQLLNDQTSRMAESDAMQRAKDAMKTGGKVVETVGKVVEATLENPAVKTTGKALYVAGEAVVKTSQKIAEPILDTQAAKAVASGVKSMQKEIRENSSSAFYSEYLPKEVRDQEKMEKIQASKDQAMRLSASGIPTSSQPILPNPDSQAVVMHRSSKMSNAWNSFKENSFIGQKLFSVKKSMEESDNPILERVREFMANSRLRETEQAKVIKAIKTVDPSFRQDTFLKEMTRYVIPDIVEASVKDDVESIKEYLSEKAYAKLKAGFEAPKAQGLVSDSKLLDIRNVDIRQMTLLEDELPVILIAFQTDEVILYRNKKGEVVLGKEDAIQRTQYVIAFTKSQLLDSEAPVDPKTNGWIIIDLHKGLGW